MPPERQVSPRSGHNTSFGAAASRSAMKCGAVTSVF